MCSRQAPVASITGVIHSKPALCLWHRVQVHAVNGRVNVLYTRVHALNDLLHRANKSSYAFHAKANADTHVLDVIPDELYSLAHVLNAEGHVVQAQWAYVLNAKAHAINEFMTKPICSEPTQSTS